jgi:hypothetical protein
MSESIARLQSDANALAPQGYAWAVFLAVRALRDTRRTVVIGGVRIELRGVVIELRGVVIELRGVMVELRGVMVELRGVRIDYPRPPPMMARHFSNEPMRR